MSTTMQIAISTSSLFLKSAIDGSTADITETIRLTTGQIRQFHQIQKPRRDSTSERVLVYDDASSG